MIARRHARRAVGTWLLAAGAVAACGRPRAPAPVAGAAASADTVLLGEWWRRALPPGTPDGARAACTLPGEPATLRIPCGPFDGRIALPLGIPARAGTHRVEVVLTAGTRADTLAFPLVARPIVVAHRGASGHRPEHTLAAYDLGITMGADYVEPDVVATRDGVLVARHEPEIGTTTDVAARFPERRATRVVDGDTVTGWFVDDLTAAELRTLRAVERLPGRSHAWDGRFPVPTLDEVLALAARRGRERGRPVGVYPELKHPAYFRARGRPLEAALVAALRRGALDRPGAPVWVQSFSWAALARVAELALGVRRVLLVAPADGVADAPAGWRAPGALLTPAGLARVRTVAQALGVEKRGVLPLAVDDTAFPAPTTLVADAHRAGLFVHVWTLRGDAPFLPAVYRGDAAAEWRRLAALGVDALFGDFPDVGRAALDAALPPAAPPP
jgi:glycerophosphoryl diester phosphodiesterase